MGRRAGRAIQARHGRRDHRRLNGTSARRKVWCAPGRRGACLGSRPGGPPQVPAASAPPFASWLTCWCPDRPAAGTARRSVLRPGVRLPGAASALALAVETAGAPGGAWPVMSCGAGAFYLGVDPGRGARGREGRHGHVRGDKASPGLPALAHRHRLDLRGERARSVRAAGFAGGRHGPRVDRASPGPPHRRTKPPAGHPQLAGHLLIRRLPRPTIRCVAACGTPSPVLLRAGCNTVPWLSVVI